MSWWSNAALLGKLATWVPYVALALGAAVTAAGIYFKSRIDNRVDFLHEEAEAERRNTPPSVDVSFGMGETSGQPVLVMEFGNDIPIEANWYVRTRKNVLVSGWQTERAKVVPTDERRRFVSKVPINAEKVVDEYIEVVFRYSSAYSAELNDPPHLRGEIVTAYRYAYGHILEWRK